MRINHTLNWKCIYSNASVSQLSHRQTRQESLETCHHLNDRTKKIPSFKNSLHCIN